MEHTSFVRHTLLLCSIRYSSVRLTLLIRSIRYSSVSSVSRPVVFWSWLESTELQRTSTGQVQET